MLFAQQAEEVAKKAEDAINNNPQFLQYAAIGVGALVVLVILVKILGGRKSIPDMQKSQREDLGEFPAPTAAGARTLNLNGLKVRMRLIVVAPSGRQKETISPEDVPNLLGDLIRGLQTVIKSDKPRIRVWPVQLSVDGFAPTFHRLVESPDADNKKSKWVRIAGPVKIGGKPYLLGMALWSDEPTKIGKIIMQQTSWGSDLKIEG